MKTKLKNALIARTSITSNKQFKRLNEKTQVLVPQNGQEEVIQSRLTHSYEVATSSEMISTFIADQLGVSKNNVDYQYSLYNVSLLHDIGHPAFGHDGAGLIDSFFLDKGLEEGFSDNNNNLVVIEKNNIKVDDYTKASVIKYPEKLYSYQKEKYFPMLDKAIQEDVENFKKYGINLSEQTTTITCQIMDEADRNTYAGSDMCDFFCLGNFIEEDELIEYAKKQGSYHLIAEYINDLWNVIKNNDKSEIKSYFSGITNEFNFNHQLTDDGISFIDEGLFHFREYLVGLTYKFFIKPVCEDEFTLANRELLEDFLHYVFDKQFYPSKHYSVLIHLEEDKEQKLRYIRDMVSEVSDWYIFKVSKEVS